MGKQFWLGNLSDNADLNFLRVPRKYIFAARKSREGGFPMVFPTASTRENGDAGNC